MLSKLLSYIQMTTESSVFLARPARQILPHQVSLRFDQQLDYIQIAIDDFQRGFELMESGLCGKVVCNWN